MKSIIIFESVHKGNTRKIAEALAGELNAKLVKPSEIEVNNLKDFDLIGFGSGIYFWQHHQSILSLAEKLPPVPGSKVFIFSTAGLPQFKLLWHWPLRNILKKKGFKIAGEFTCSGHDEVGPLKMFGGINKGRPNGKDIEKAREFANSLL
ncbi:flavodoxin [Candidatus Shapirobacteria bacterium CG03_land_8_20_14_0_80_39_12]|uniref:Flavodoxin n=1 Tax=Candidatus Shapirobacteria bacterium CG03_land_8_20_14_0_80_39_12 TaxID=1974879 RepID=A0A2M7BD60_9BACT|nr:MAG: flavodoxin [Candidatus Shapirobacteria bacterium CG03_land_8_20_14_0_80_39_12]